MPTSDHDGRGPDDPESRSLVLRLLDKAIETQSPMVSKNITRARHRNRAATPAEVVRALERMYLATQTTTGAAVGGAAAVPAIGTGLALAMSAGEALTSLEVSALFVLSVSDVHGIPVDEVERRRALVLGILLGGGGRKTIAEATNRTARHWARHVVDGVPAQTLRQINKVLGQNFITKYGSKQGIVVLGRIVPFGIGAALGGGASALLVAGA
ncbi:hypothetical protein ACFQ1I_33130 [Kitasatospora arboriphila]